MARGEQIAQARLFNGSIKMHRGPCSCGFGLTWYLHFSTYGTDDPSRANEELAPIPQPAAYTHWSYMILEDPSMYGSMSLVQLDLPTTDSNGDGILDIVDTTRAVSSATAGTYENDWGQQVIKAVWNRGEGLTQGTCDITLKDSILGDLGPFHNTFEVVQYEGTVKYTPGSNNVATSMLLTKVGDASFQFEAAMSFIKSATNRFDELDSEAATWTHSVNGPVDFGAAILIRDPARPSNYRASLQTAGGSYASWWLSIEDPNDADHDGIPDLSDDLLAPRVPRKPSLSLDCTPTDLKLTIAGDVGSAHRILEANSPTAAVWMTVREVMLTTDPQIISLPLPVGQSKFWRVEAH
jgi:hypothetical protein